MALESPLPGTVKLTYAISLLIAGGLFKLFLSVYARRRRMFDLQKQGLPMPPYHALFGHLPTMARVSANLPSDLHSHCRPEYVRRTMPGPPPFFYLDPWPFAKPVLVIADPLTAFQVTQGSSPPKHDVVHKFLLAIAGDNSLITLEGKKWKTWRGIFNPGFSTGHLMTLVPGIVEDGLQFCEILQSHAKKGDVFQMEEVATRLTVDVIGRVVLDTRLHSQTSENELVSAFRSQIRWLPSANTINPFSRYNPFRPIMNWYNSFLMTRYLSRELEDRFASRRRNSSVEVKTRSKSVIDLALDAYHEDETSPVESQGMDATFKSFAISQIRTFIFAGHDTTSSTICYVYHLLSKNPSCMTKICAEHDSVFGTNPNLAAEVITQSPHLLNKLPYSLAVIKETLRLFPPISTIRKGSPDLHITHEGRSYPTDGFMVWPLSQAMHRNSTLWPSPAAFLPDRWLVPEGDPLFPIKGAWRPFELGPRNCIGQELAILETKIILALTVRRFGFEAIYDELDAKLGPKAVKTMEGESAYQIKMGTAKPRGQMPCRVWLRD